MFNKVGEKDMKKKFIILICIIFFILILLAAFLFIYFKTDIIKQNSNMSIAKSRTSYVITEDKNLYNNLNDKDNTLIIFWATWCHYCVEESNDLNEYIKNNPYKSIIVVSHDDNKDEVKNYLEENGYNWFVILDPEKTIRENIDPGSNGIPSSYLLDKEGKIINFHKGKLTKDQFISFFNGVEI